MTKTTNKRKYKTNRAAERFQEWLQKKARLHNGVEFITLTKKQLLYLAGYSFDDN